MSTRIRLATEDDAPAMLAIYAPVVRDTTISLELEVPTEDAFRERIRATLAHATWLVCEVDGVVAGYAYATGFRARAAYQWTVEVTVYVARDYARRGVARVLYSELFTELAAAGFETAVAVIALPNDASVALHEGLGFARVGVLARAGFKHGAWVDVGFWQRAIGGATGSPPTAPVRPGGARGA